MAKNRLTPLKDEPTTSFDELISKIDNLARVINQQNGYLRVIAQKDGFDSEYNFLRHQFNATSAIHEALVKYLKENKAEIVVDGEENNKLAKAEELLNKYQALLTEAMEIIKNRNTATSPVTTVVIHEPLPTETVSYQMFLHILLFQALAYHYHGECLVRLCFSDLYHGC